MHEESVFYHAGLLIIDALENAKKRISQTFAEDFMAPGRIINLLNQEINRVRFEQCGMDPIDFGNAFNSDRTEAAGTNGSSAIGGPLTKMLGKEINTHLVNAGPEIEMTDDLRRQVNEMEKTFLDLDDEQVLAIDEKLVRALAKHLGIFVTETSPEKINLKLIADIRFAIQKRLINTLSQ